MFKPIIKFLFFQFDFFSLNFMSFLHILRFIVYLHICSNNLTPEQRQQMDAAEKQDKAIQSQMSKDHEYV